MEGTNSKSNTKGTVRTTKPEQDGHMQVAYSNESYKLPIVDTVTERRDFPGVKEYHFVTKEDFFKEGDLSGTTDTDEVTERSGRGGSKIGYTRIYGNPRKSGMKGSAIYG